MTKIIAHRGSRINRPENTLAAFEEALRVGADGIELDVQLSKDGQLVVIHDETLERTTSGKGWVKDYTLAELQQVDAGSCFGEEWSGEKIPSLRQVLSLLERAAFQGELHIELKTSRVAYKGIEAAVVDLLGEQERAFSVVYSSFNPLSLLRIALRQKSAQLALLLKKESGCMSWFAHVPLFTALHLSQKAYQQWGKTSKKLVRLWTLNEESALQKAYEQQVAGVITDKPEMAKQLLIRMKEQTG